MIGGQVPVRAVKVYWSARFVTRDYGADRVLWLPGADLAAVLADLRRLRVPIMAVDVDGSGVARVWTTGDRRPVGDAGAHRGTGTGDRVTV